MAKAGNPRNVIGIIKELDSNTKVIGLLILVAEALFTTAIFKVDHNQVFWAICVAAAFLVIMGIALVRLETRKIPATEHLATAVIPSSGTPSTQILDSIINGAIQAVCRAVTLPNTPQGVKLRVFIFDIKGQELVCSHLWAQDPVREQVGILKFAININVAKKIAVVRAAMNGTTCRSAVEPIPKSTPGIAGDVSDDLTFVLAAPIKDATGRICGTVDFDTASDGGRELLSTESAESVIYHLAEHIGAIMSLRQPRLSDARSV
jgi:hypothetical protein